MTDSNIAGVGEGDTLTVHAGAEAEVSGENYEGKEDETLDKCNQCEYEQVNNKNITSHAFFS